MKKILVSTILLLAGLAIFVFGSPYYAVFPTNRNKLYYVLLTVVFLIASVVLRRSRSLSRYAPAACSLFIASAALLFMSTGIVNIRARAAGPLDELVLDKLSQFLHVVPVIIALTLATKTKLKSIFVARGGLRAGLLFGGISFLGFAIVAYVMQAGSGGLPQLSARTALLVLLFVFLNAIMEELWFRAVFLKPYQAVIGRTAAIVVTSVVFGSVHLFATYDFPGGSIVFGLVVFALGLGGAYSMSKTESLIGPVLFHAGYDLMVIAPVLASM